MIILDDIANTGDRKKGPGNEIFSGLEVEWITPWMRPSCWKLPRGLGRTHNLHGRGYF